jgi:hypothetical protein
MHRIAAALLERETIDAEEVKMLIEGKELPPMRSCWLRPATPAAAAAAGAQAGSSRGGPSFPEGSPSPAEPRVREEVTLEGIRRDDFHFKERGFYRVFIR